MPTTLLRGSTGESRRTSESGYSLLDRCRPTYKGSPLSATTTQSSSGMPCSSTSPVTTPNWGSSPVVNLAIRTGSPSRRTLHAVPPPVLARAEWQAHAEAHRGRVAAWVQPHLERRRHREAHPVHDFL